MAVENKHVAQGVTNITFLPNNDDNEKLQKEDEKNINLSGKTTKVTWCHVIQSWDPPSSV